MHFGQSFMYQGLYFIAAAAFLGLVIFAIKAVINKFKTNVTSRPTTNHKAVRNYKMRINEKIDDNSKISVIIPTYNRFDYVLNSIESVRKQIYRNFEIIVVNDCSSQSEYYTHDFGQDVQLIHLKENSKKKFGFACSGGYQTNFGIERATGKYVAFLDDDDVWLPEKLRLQMEAIKRTGCKMSCTDGFIGDGVYNPENTYKKYNSEHHYNILQSIFRKANSNVIVNGFPKIWTLELLKVHNCIICSSVLIEKSIMNKVGGFKPMNYTDDYDCWLRVMKYTDCAYISDACFHYDRGHGGGVQY